MKVTYIYPPLFKPFYPMATRIITENLLRNKDIEVDFSDIPVTTYVSGTADRIYHEIMKKAAHRASPNVLSFLSQKYMVYNIFYVFMAQGYFDEFILVDPDSEYTILTCLNFCDLLILKHLLQKGKRVVLGGPLINIGLSPTFIRRFMELMGVEPRKLRDNLIVVSGNIDLTTDLYRIIKEWKDTAITGNSYGTVYECRQDFLKDLYQEPGTVPVHMGFSNHCWYGRCRFCTYRELPRMNFLDGREADQTVLSIHRLMNYFGSDRIRFIDSYFRRNSPLVQEILEQIGEYHITVYTGITLLKDRRYIEFLNRHVNCLLIGLESTSDFSLRQVDKGYTWADIETAVDNIISRMNRDIFLEISIILDLPSRDREDVRANYRKIAQLKERLTGEGFRVAFHMNILSLFPNLELLTTGAGLLSCSTDGSHVDGATGKNHIIGVLRRCGMDRTLKLPSKAVLRDEDNPYSLLYGYISSDVTIVRRDVNGNVLPSDLDLMDEAVMKEILRRTVSRV
ncbi:MAG: hypothetical protein JRF51_14120 [Deltaproteobacteria bacterium]|nr:hypothetical protein [Deltaproteobacteria bacterium]MBW2354343.1 hypothetical protein [Deltaproteobacteria bacterium]